MNETGGDIIQYITEIATIKNEWMRHAGHCRCMGILHIAERFTDRTEVLQKCGSFVYCHMKTEHWTSYTNIFAVIFVVNATRVIFCKLQRNFLCFTAEFSAVMQDIFVNFYEPVQWWEKSRKVKKKSFEFTRIFLKLFLLNINTASASSVNSQGIKIF